MSITVHEEGPIAVTVQSSDTPVIVTTAQAPPVNLIVSEGLPGAPGPAGASVNLFRYNYNANLTAPPSSGQVRCNTPTIADSTLVWVHVMDNQNQDERLMLLQGRTGDELFIQDQQNSGCFVRYNLTADAHDDTTYVTFTVDEIEAGTDPLAGSAVMLGVLRRAQGTQVIGVPYAQWPPTDPQQDTLYLKLAP